jgi:hypothetical protein
VSLKQVSVRQRIAVAAAGLLAVAGGVFGGTAAARASAVTARMEPASTVAAASTAAGTGCPSDVNARQTALARPAAAPAGWAAGVPWSTMGAGWILAAAAKSAPTTVNPSQTLYLIAPGGQRYTLGAAPAGTLSAWQPGGRYALFESQPDNSTTLTITLLNVKTGARSGFTMYSGLPFSQVAFTKPTGTALLVQAAATPHGFYLPLQRLALNGTRELCYPQKYAGGGFQENATGTELVFGAANGLDVVSNSGQLIRTLPGSSGCGLENLWNGQSVVANCDAQLKVFPLSGAQPTALTSSRDGNTFVGAWHLPSGTYAEAAACGTTWLEKLNQNGTAARLTIPGAATAGTVNPLGTYGDELPLQIGGGCDTKFAYSMIDWYNPSANTAKTVLGGPSGGGYVLTAELYQEP